MSLPNENFSSSGESEEDSDCVQSETEEEVLLSSDDESSAEDKTHVNNQSVTNCQQDTDHPTNMEADDNRNEEIVWGNCTKTARWVIPGESKLEERKLTLKHGIDLTKRSHPVEFFNLFVTPDLYELVSTQTNLYKTSLTLSGKKNHGAKKIEPVTIEDIKKVFGIILYMGVVKLPNRRMYWKYQTRIDLIANAMPVNRFGQILSVFHYNNNDLIPRGNDSEYNRCYKLQPIIDHLREKFSSTVVPETFLAVDEQVVPFKGASGLKRYLPKKPKKWGYKLWAMAGMSGYVYNFEIDGEKGKAGPPVGCSAPRSVGESGFVVLRLSKHLEENKHKLFFDNYFCSPELIDYLLMKKIWAIGTLNMKRSRKCPVTSEKDLKKEGRGATVEVVAKNKPIVVTAWNDNKRVTIISNFIGKEPLGECNRFDRKKRETVTVTRPAAVQTYNNYMGGVDKADMLLALYRTKYRSRKWYQRIAFHLISQCAVNAWIIHREIGGQYSYLDFLTEICVSLINASPDNDSLFEPPSTKRVKAADVPTNVRHDKFDHWPLLMDMKNAMRCKMDGCKKKTMFHCSKCQVFLCVNKNSCFLDFHRAGVE